MTQAADRGAVSHVGTRNLNYRKNLLSMLDSGLRRAVVDQGVSVPHGGLHSRPPGQPVIEVLAQPECLATGAAADDGKVPGGMSHFTEEGAAFGAAYRDGRKLTIGVISNLLTASPRHARRQSNGCA